MTTPNKEDLIEKIAALRSEHGPNWKKIADELNREQIATLTGQAWNKKSARAFYNRHRQAAPKTLPKNYPSLPEWLDDAALEDLHQMLDEWRVGEKDLLRQTETRPVFRGGPDDRRNTGVHIHKEILTRAMDKVKTDKVRTGGSLSKLVELLLWEYIGRPTDLLETIPGGEDEKEH